jgi:hypothetical protein
MLRRHDPGTTAHTVGIRRCVALVCAAALALFLVPASASGAGSTAAPRDLLAVPASAGAAGSRRIVKSCGRRVLHDHAATFSVGVF